MTEIKTIPPGMLKPGVHGEFDTAGGSNALPANSYRMLVIGQQLSGSVAALVPTQVFSESQAKEFWGAGSIIARMMSKAIKHYSGLDIHGIGLADGSAASAATATVTLTGTATAAGSIVLFVGNDRIEVAVAKGDTDAEVAEVLKTEIAARPDFPLTATAATNVLTTTAKCKGPVGNQLVVYATSSAAGLTIPAKTALATGATGPDVAAALSVIVPGAWDVIVYQDSDADTLALLKAHADLVSSAVEQRPCRVFCASQDTLANQATLAGNINYERIHIVGIRGCRNPAFEIAAVVAAEVTKSFDPAMPFDGAPLTGLHCPAEKDWWLRTEQETLLHAGVTPLEVIDGELTIVRLVTTRSKTSGVADLTLIDTNTMAIMDGYSKAWRTRMRQKFGRAKLEDMTIDQVLTQTLDVAYRLQALRWLQKVDDYKAGFIAQRDPNAPGRIIMEIPSPIVPGLHQIFASFKLILN